MLSKEKTMEILEAYDLTKSYRVAAELTGVDHHTVARQVNNRVAGRIGEGTDTRAMVTDPFVDKVTEWIDRSNGKIRADVVHERLASMGYTGSERTTRRVVKVLKDGWKHDHHRIYKPWITEPGLWLQYDYGDGPVIEAQKTVLFCAWLAWSRFRVIIPLMDKTLPSVIAALDRAFRLMGGVPTYVLTDNERTVTDCHIAGIAVRNETAVSVSRYYGTTIVTCVPYDPESKGGSESTVKIAKADLVPTEYNLLTSYNSFDELERAAEALSHTLNNRIHIVTNRVPKDALKDEIAHLHQVPDAPYSAAFGQSRSVGWSSTVTFGGSRYSVPHYLCGSYVWVRIQGNEIVIVADEVGSAHEVARHPRLSRGQASISDEHYPPRVKNPSERMPKAKKPSEEAFLSLGEGARLYLVEAAASGVRRIEDRMAEAVTLAAFHGKEAVDNALDSAALARRFEMGDLESIITHAKGSLLQRSHIRSIHSLAASTSAWNGIGNTAGGPR